MSSKKMPDPAVVADMLHSAAIHLLRRVRKTDEHIGLSPARLSILSILVFAGDRPLGELARMEQVKPPTMTKLVQGLEDDGLVVRKPDKLDKRASIIKATAKGRNKLLKAQQLRLEYLTALINPLDTNEIAILVEASRLLEKLVSSD